MKIYYIANVRIPTEKAHGLQIMNMCASFAENGADVTLVVPTRVNLDLTVTEPFGYYNVQRNFTIARLVTFDPYWLIRFKQGLYIKIQSLLFTAALLLYLLRQKDRHQTLLYTRDEILLPLLLRLSPRVIWEAHTLPKNLKRYRGFFHRCHRIVAITALIKERLVAAGIDEKKILVASDAVNATSFAIAETVAQCRQQLLLPLQQKIVMYTGHLFEWKGVYTLAAAQAFLSADIHMIFVGGTTADQKKISDFIRDKKLQHISIVGHRPPSEIPYYLKAADVLVLPNSGQETISTHYTSPLKLFEYMAAKKPIVASDLPSIREILNSQNAVLVKPDSPPDLASGITRVLNNPQFATVIAEKAFAQVQKNTWSSRALAILSFV